MDNSQAREWARIGAMYQIPMILCFVGILGWSVVVPIERPWQYHLPGYIGCLLFAWCLYELYIRKAHVTKLITNGPFRYTRHPMYVGLALMNLSVVLTSQFNGVMMMLQIAWLCLLILTGFCQEQETRARFGWAAEEYYARTYRLPWFPRSTNKE